MTDQATRLRRMMEAGDAPHVRPVMSVSATSAPAATADPELTSSPPSPPPRSARVSVGPPAATVDVRDNGTSPGAAVAPSRAQTRAPAKTVQLARTIAVTSGKGGVGKSNVALNLAVCLAMRGKKVCLLDADLGLANIDVLCGLNPRLTLEHVIAGKCRLVDVAIAGPGGFRLIPGASGVARLTELDSDHRHRLLTNLAALERVADVIVIDTGAGINENVLAFAGAAHAVLVTTTPEPPAMTDAYGVIKALAHRRSKANLRLLVNMVASESEARGVHRRIDRVARTFLQRPIDFAGSIPHDASVTRAVRDRQPFVLHDPASQASRRMQQISMGLAGLEAETDGRSGEGGFFARVSSWFGLRRGE